MKDVKQSFNETIIFESKQDLINEIEDQSDNFYTHYDKLKAEREILKKLVCLVFTLKNIYSVKN